jgi:hypothetical protein
VLLRLLHRQGIGGEVRFGARKNMGRFEAHAWVEWHGLPLGEAGDPHVEFVTLGVPVTATSEARTRAPMM